MGHENPRASRGPKSSCYPVRSGIELRLLELPYVRWSDDFQSTHLLTSLDDIMTAIMPEEEQDDLPTGFTIVGHVGMLAEVSSFSLAL